jgi:N-methylhydantoinase B
VAKIDRDGIATPQPVIGDVELEPGEWVRGLESGGGGYGDPLDRDTEAVRLDVLDRWVSAEAARDDYGVVLAGRAEDCDVSVDVAGTERLRGRMREARAAS